MKFTVTTKNIKTIAGILRKARSNKTLKDQLFYPTTKKRDTFRKNIGIKRDSILKSNLCFFEDVVIETDISFGDNIPFIRVHNNDQTEDNFNWSNYRAFVIYVGDTIDVKNNVFHIKTQHPTNRKEKALQIISFN